MSHKNSLKEGTHLLYPLPGRQMNLMLYYPKILKGKTWLWSVQLLLFARAGVCQCVGANGAW